MNGPIVTTSTTPEGALIIPQDVRKIGLWDKGALIMGTDQQPQPEGTTLLAGHVNDVAQGNGTLHDFTRSSPARSSTSPIRPAPLPGWRVVGLDVVVKAAPGSWRGETEQVSTGSPYSSCWRSSPVPSCGWPSPSARPRATRLRRRSRLRSYRRCAHRAVEMMRQAKAGLSVNLNAVTEDLRFRGLSAGGVCRDVSVKAAILPR